MAGTQIALQLYTVREFAHEIEQLEPTVKKLKKIGYKAVQLIDWVNAWDPQRVADIFHGQGFEIIGGHGSFMWLRDETDAVIEQHRIWDSQYVTMARPPLEYKDAASWVNFAHECNEVAKRYTEAGLVFSYHNHNFDMQKFDGRTGVEIVADETDPAVVNFEIDTYWLAADGGCPAAWLRKLKGRVPLVHCKDMGVTGRETKMKEVGEGNMDWPGIIAAGKESGVSWYIYEQDWQRQMDLFESCAISYRNLRAFGLQ